MLGLNTNLEIGHKFDNFYMVFNHLERIKAMFENCKKVVKLQ